jgi:hypothetical protein
MGSVLSRLSQDKGQPFLKTTPLGQSPNNVGAIGDLASGLRQSAKPSIPAAQNDYVDVPADLVPRALAILAKETAEWRTAPPGHLKPGSAR